MGIFRKILLHLDLLKSPYNLKLNHNEKTGTPLGGIISSIVLIGLIFYFIVIVSKALNENGRTQTSI